MGLGSPFLDEDFEAYGFLLTDCLWKSIWEFVSGYRIRLVYHDQVLPKLQRNNDRFIMEALFSCAELTQADLISCNRCRLALESVTLADIVTGDGQCFRPDCLGADLSLSPRSSWEFPVEQPSRGDKDSWVKGLKLLSSANLTLDDPHRLKEWITEPHKKWEWYFHSSSNTLYRHAHQAWHAYDPTSPHVTRHRTFRRTSLLRTPPTDMARATAWLDRHGRAHFEGAFTDSLPASTSEFNTIQDMIASWPDNWPLNQCHFPPDPTALIQAIQDGTAHGVCDGSYMPTASTAVGTAAWKIEDPASQQAMQGVTRTSGVESEVDSYRSELQGLHAMLLGLLAFCTFHKITDGQVTLGCDNFNGVRQARGEWLKVPLRAAHSDLIRAIRVLKAKLPIRVVMEHVKGHQDDFTFYEDLERLAQMNVDVDDLAKAYLRDVLALDTIPRCPPAIAHEGWQCYVMNNKVTSHPASAIRLNVFGALLAQKLVQRDGKISAAGFNNINWTAIEHASDLFPPLYRLWVAKHVSGFFGVGHMMKIWQFWDHSRCPCCDHEDETKEHLMTCPHPACAATWSDSLAGFRAWMIEVDTAPSIRDCLLQTLATRDPFQSFTTFSDDSTMLAAQAQDEIGWIFTTEGKMSKAWERLQAQHYHSLDSRRSARKWSAGLTTNLLHITHSQWSHRNSVLHERDALGLKLKEGQELTAAIQTQFALGLDGLLTRDHHYINRGLEHINALPAANRKAWLSGIQIARELYLASEVKEMESMRSFMLNWLATA